MSRTLALGFANKALPRVRTVVKFFANPSPKSRDTSTLPPVQNDKACSELTPNELGPAQKILMHTVLRKASDPT